MDPIVTIRDAASGSTARIARHLGFNCFEFSARFSGRVVDVLYADPDFASGKLPPTRHGIPILFPFPNRIRGGRFTWEGRDYHLPKETVPYDPAGANAIHGFCLDRPWRVTASGDSYVVGEFQLSKDAPERRALWPSDALIEMRYGVRGATLRADIRIANLGEAPLPWGFGTHPYFRVPLASDSDGKHCLVEAPAAELWELVETLPTGARHPVPPEKNLREGAYFDQLQIDDVLTGLPSGPRPTECLIMDEKAGLQVVQRFDPAVFRELVVFTPPTRASVCLEPYTCITDAINLQQRGIDAGLRVLGPGEEVRTWIEIEAGLVIA